MSKFEILLMTFYLYIVYRIFFVADKFKEVFEKQRQELLEKERNRIRLLTADPFDPEVQDKIAEEIRYHQYCVL